METMVRTVYGAALQTALLLNKPITMLQYTTLNEKLNIHTDVVIADGDRHVFQYIAIGNGGHRASIGANGQTSITIIPKTPKQAALYNQLPFVLRLLNNDLTPTERAQYRLRRIETHDGVQYAAYYLKLIDMSNTAPVLELRTVVNGNTTSAPFVPSLSDLNPTPPPIQSGDVLVATGDYIAATSKVQFIMTQDEVDEFINACNIIYNDDNYAIISEIAFCAGVDKAVTGNFNGSTVGYTDAVGVQVINNMSAVYLAKYTNAGITMDIDVGNVEPLLTLS